jgi:hypothetical protein
LRWDVRLLTYISEAEEQFARWKKISNPGRPAGYALLPSKPQEKCFAIGGIGSQIETAKLTPQISLLKQGSAQVDLKHRSAGSQFASSFVQNKRDCKASRFPFLELYDKPLMAAEHIYAFILMAVFGSVAFSSRIVRGLAQLGSVAVAAASVVALQGDSLDLQADSVVCPLLRPDCSDWVPGLLASFAPFAEHQVRTWVWRMSR